MGHILIMSVEGPGDRNPEHGSRASAGWHPPHPPTLWPQLTPQADAVSQQLCYAVTLCWSHQTAGLWGHGWTEPVTAYLTLVSGDD